MRNSAKYRLLKRIEVVAETGASLKLSIPGQGEGWVPRKVIAWTSQDEAMLPGWVLKKCLAPLKIARQIALF